MLPSPMCPSLARSTLLDSSLYVQKLSPSAFASTVKIAASWCAAPLRRCRGAMLQPADPRAREACRFVKLVSLAGGGSGGRVGSGSWWGGGDTTWRV